MKKLSLISVIIPSHNRAEQVLEAIASVIGSLMPARLRQRLVSIWRKRHFPAQENHRSNSAITL